MKIHAIRVFVAGLIALAVVGCSSTRPIYNVDAFMFPSNDVDKLSQATLDEIAVATGVSLGWQLAAAGPGRFVANRQDQAMSAKIDLTISMDSIDIKYRSSKNLGEGDGKIEPIYNRWIRKLKYSISDAVIEAAEE